MGFEIVVVNKKRCKCGDYHFDFIVDGKTIDDGRFGMAAGNRFTIKLGSAIGREFDTYSMELLTGIVTEKGICYPPFTESLAALFRDKK